MNQLSKYAKYCYEDYGKLTYKYAWFVDKTKAEIERAITIGNIPTLKIETNKNNYSLINVPGYLEYTKNMIRGISIADIGVLVVPIKKGQEMKNTIEQTKEFAIRLFVMGVKKIVVTINQIDTVYYN